MYKTIKINAGDGGWGGPLTVTPTETCHTVLSVTGGGIHPVAQAIADMSGGVLSGECNSSRNAVSHRGVG